VILKAQVNYVGRTSMEIGVKVWSENPLNGDLRHTSSAYLTFVAMDETRQPVAVPPLELESEEDRRRNRDAADRRSANLAAIKKKADG
jgi:acyl-CoA hydrolase